MNSRLASDGTSTATLWLCAEATRAPRAGHVAEFAGGVADLLRQFFGDAGDAAQRARRGDRADLGAARDFVESGRPVVRVFLSFLVMLIVACLPNKIPGTKVALSRDLGNRLRRPVRHCPRGISTDHNDKKAEPGSRDFFQVAKTALSHA